MDFKRTTLTLAIASSLALVGCSGGSSSSGSDVGDFGSSSATVSGSAVKGIMKSATVTAFELDANGERIGSVGTTETDAEGQYELSLGGSYQGGLVEIEVTVNERTRMVCDAAACGTVGADVELPATFKLSSITGKAGNDNTLSAPVTAWSTMASKRTRALIAQGKSVSDANRQAVAEVNQVAGFDVSRTNAKAVTNLGGSSASEQQAAIMNAVVAELVFAGGNAAEGLESFASALDDGVAGNDGDSFTAEVLASTTRDLVDSQPDLAPEAKDSLNTQVAEYDNNPDGVAPTYDESLDVADDATQAEKIEAFKSFVGQVRTWGATIEGLDSAELEAVIGAQTETFQNVLGSNANSLQMTLDIAGQALSTALSDPAAIQEALANDTTIEAPLLDGEVEVGTLELSFADEQGLVMSVTGAVTGEAQTTYLPFDLTLDSNLPTSALDLDIGAVTALAESNSMVLSGTFDNGSGITLAKLNDLTLRLELSDAVAAESGVTTDGLNNAFLAASFQGDVQLFAESGESFTGEVEARVTRLTANRRESLNDAPVSFDRLRVAGDFANDDGSVFRASAALNVNNSASFDTFAWLDFSEETVFFNGPVDASTLMSSIDVPEGAVAPSVSVEAWQQGSGELMGHLWGDWWVGDGQDLFYYRALNAEELAQATDLAGQALIAALPETLTLSYPDENGDPVEELLNIADAVNRGQIKMANYYAYGPYAQADVMLVWDGSPLPPGVTSADVVKGLTPEERDRSRFDVFEGSSGPQSSLDLTLLEQSKLLDFLKVQHPTVGLTGAEVNEIWIENTPEYGYGSVYVQRPAELAYYEECFAAPVTQLELMGESYMLEYSSPEQACAYATLSQEWVSREATSQELAAASAAVSGGLVTRYGDFAQQAAVNDFYVYADSSEGFAYSEVEFPNLESADNFIDASFTVASSLNLPELPEARVSATVSRNSFVGGRVRATVGWDGGQYSLELASGNVEDLSGVTARFFNPQGYELQLAAVFDEAGEFAGVTGDAFINGEDIGDVTMRNGMPVITYPNASTTEFETLF